MKKIISEPKGCLTLMLSLIIICEVLLKIDNRIIQTIGICLTPIIVILVILFIKSDKQKVQ